MIYFALFAEIVLALIGWKLFGEQTWETVPEARKPPFGCGRGRILAALFLTPLVAGLAVIIVFFWPLAAFIEESPFETQRRWDNARNSVWLKKMYREQYHEGSDRSHD